MWGVVRGVIWGLALIGFGWIVGSVFPAPAAITQPIAQRSQSLAARLGIDEVSFSTLGGLMSAEELAGLRREASALAARSGEAIIVERDAEQLEQQLASLPERPAPSAGVSGAAAFETTLSLCPGMSIANAPAADGARALINYRNTLDVQGVRLAVNPTRGACLSSGFGPRGSGRHNGVDYHSAQGGPIMAAADGEVIEAKYRDDYGNMLLIDHGGGVYTRYAHLSSFAPGVVLGARVSAGQQIGLMGNTASYAIPVHLHYEVLTGDYDNPRASFGLTPRSPFG